MYVGFEVATFPANSTPCVEVGWRLARAYWGCGYATEGAQAALQFGFETIGLPEIVSFTTAANVRSRRVMERLGMQHAASDDFNHPRLPEGHPLRPHILYRMSLQRWRELLVAG